MISLKAIDAHKNVTNPYLFRGAPMVTTFVCSAGSHTKGLLGFLEETSRADIRLVELEHPTLKKLCFLFGQNPDLCSHIVLQGPKIDVPLRYLRNFPTRASYHWTWYRFPASRRHHLQTRGLPARSRQWVK